MLILHSSQYLIGRGVPALVNIASIALFTRFLSPSDYGTYILTLATASLVNVSMFQWLRLGVLRFYPMYAQNPRAFFPSVFGLFVATLLILLVMGTLFALVMPVSNELLANILISVLLAGLLAWYELNLEATRSQLRPTRYGYMTATKSISSLLLGMAFVLAGYEAYGALIGLALGLFLTSVLFAIIPAWGVRRPSGKITRLLIGYGLPLTATAALDYVIVSSDRFIIAAGASQSAAGVYAAAYDLGQQSVMVLMSIINLAAFPLAVRALETDGVRAAAIQLQKNASLMLTVAVPATGGLIVLGPALSSIILGAAYQEAAIILVPYIAVAALISGVRAFHFDLAFHLGNNTKSQITVLAVGAATNVGVTLLLLPSLGLLGVAIATVLAYSTALITSIILGQRVYQMPFPTIEFFRVVVASSIVWIVIQQLQRVLPADSIIMLIAYAALAVLLYAVLAVCLNICRMKEMVRIWLRRT